MTNHDVVIAPGAFDLPIMFSKLFLVTVLNRGLSLINPFADLLGCVATCWH
jgi:hypothetical protein